MATETTNLKLHVVPSNDYTKYFDEWRKEMASDESTSNMVIIDTAIAGKLDSENPVITGSIGKNLNEDNGEVGYNSDTLGFYCYAGGDYAYAEGFSTKANGMASHSEGLGTIASGNAQHAQGSLNIEDTDGKYAHIVGNGESEGKRSNAHTLDWGGNAWFAGNVYVGGTGQDDTAAVKLATATELATKQDTITGAVSNVVAANLTASRAARVNANGKLAVSNTTDTELGYLSGVTSNVQTQLNSKQAALTFDSAPTNGSTNPVTSGAVYTALAGKEPTINLTVSRAIVSDASGKLTVSTVTSTELGYLSGITSNIQTQLNSKQATITGGATTITSSNLTASRALISNSSGKVAASDITSTELGYLDGVTSNIQTQLNGSAITNVTASTTLTSTHAGKFVNASSTSAITITIPAGTTIPVGSEIEIWRGNTGTVTITGASTAVYAYIPGNTAAVVLSGNQVSIGDQYASVTLKHITSGYWSIQPAQ